MMGLLGPVHPLGGEHADGDLLAQEVVDEGARDAVVELLLLGGVEAFVQGVGLHELAERVAVDVVVHLAADHALVEVEPLAAPPRPNATSLDHLLHDATRLPALLDEGEDEPDDVRDHVAVLQLLGFF